MGATGSTVCFPLLRYQCRLFLMLSMPRNFCFAHTFKSLERHEPKQDHQIKENIQRLTDNRSNPQMSHIVHHWEAPATHKLRTCGCSIQKEGPNRSNPIDQEKGTQCSRGDNITVPLSDAYTSRRQGGSGDLYIHGHTQ